jgi:hypothetical protein
MTFKDLPMLVRVRNEFYRICFPKKMKENDVGACDDECKLIMISRAENEDPRELHATVWHELLHAFESEFKVNLGHRTIRKLEYFIVDTIAQFPKKAP